MLCMLLDETRCSRNQFIVRWGGWTVEVTSASSCVDGFGLVSWDTVGRRRVNKYDAWDGSGRDGRPRRSVSCTLPAWFTGHRHSLA